MADEKDTRVKLWSKGYDVDEKIERFTVGNDYILDQEILPFDCQASKAHVEMLCAIGVLTEDEKKQLIVGLDEIIELHQENNFPIDLSDEDCHTAIENFLVAKYGELGKKIHCARSRNDQVLTALRLYEKKQLGVIEQDLQNLISALQKSTTQYGSIPLPGYTHMQRAMPSSVEMWLGCFIESMRDNIQLLESVVKLIDQSPLGTAAGFGVPVFQIDREMTAKIMGFSKVITNPIYAQMTRGKFEANIINVLVNVMYDLNRLASDLVTFSMAEFGFLKLPVRMCTGSSIMPNKKNPDVLELIRARYHIIVAEELKMKSLLANLISGYHRDVQLTKEPLLNSFSIAHESIEIMGLVIANMQLCEEQCKQAMSEELFATEEAYKLVKEGYSFREAYKKVAQKYMD